MLLGLLRPKLSAIATMGRLLRALARIATAVRLLRVAVSVLAPMRQAAFLLVAHMVSTSAKKTLPAVLSGSAARRL